MICTESTSAANVFLISLTSWLRILSMRTRLSWRRLAKTGMHFSRRVRVLLDAKAVPDATMVTDLAVTSAAIEIKAATAVRRAVLKETVRTRKMACITVKIKAGEGVTLPAYATPGSSGMDIRASESAVIKAGERGCVATGLFLEMPLGCEAQIRPRSGLAFKNGVTVLNSPGTIDSDYRGEIKVILINLGSEDFVIEPGDRIAQMVFAQVTQVNLIKAAELNDTERSSGGFGSTGKN